MRGVIVFLLLGMVCGQIQVYAQPSPRDAPDGGVTFHPARPAVLRSGRGTNIEVDSDTDTTYADLPKHSVPPHSNLNLPFEILFESLVRAVEKMFCIKRK